MAWAYIHNRFDIGPGDKVVFSVSCEAMVRLLTPDQFSFYKASKPFRYEGGKARLTRVVLQPSEPGVWHAVIDSYAKGRFNIEKLDATVADLGACLGGSESDPDMMDLVVKIPMRTFRALAKVSEEFGTPASEILGGMIRIATSRHDPVAKAELEASVALIGMSADA